jgi:hypothetical protein
MAQTGHNGHRQVLIGADGSQWARATLRGGTDNPFARLGITTYSASTDTFPPGADACLLYEDSFCLIE